MLPDPLKETPTRPRILSNEDREPALQLVFRKVRYLCRFDDSAPLRIYRKSHSKLKKLLFMILLAILVLKFTIKRKLNSSVKPGFCVCFVRSELPCVTAEKLKKFASHSHLQGFAQNCLRLFC